MDENTALADDFTKGAKVGNLETIVLSEPAADMKNWTLTLPPSVKQEHKVWMVIRFTIEQ